MRRESLVIPLWRSWRVYGACAVLALGVVGVKSVSAQCMYEVTATFQGPDCPPFGHGAIIPTAINDHGVIVGYYRPCPLDNYKPFMWSEETGFVAIPLPADIEEAEPQDINNHGEIVGVMDPAGSGGVRAFHYKDGIWTNLGLLPGHGESRALAINNIGEIVGEGFNPGLAACIWREGVIEAVDLPIGPHSSSSDISDASALVGWMGTGESTGFLQSNQQTIGIRPLPESDTAHPEAMTDSHIIAGRSRIPVRSGPVGTRSWMWSDGQLIDLGSFGENIRTRANDISDAVQIVGTSANGLNSNRIPFLWQHDEISDLRLLIPDLPRDLSLGSARAINNLGQIVVSDSSDAKVILLRPSDRMLGDVNSDCVVDDRDLIAVLDDWGPDKLGHLTDIVTNSTFQPPGEGVVDGADLAVVLGNWSVSGSGSLTPRR